MTKYDDLLVMIQQVMIQQVMIQQVMIQQVTSECIIGPGRPSGDGYGRVSRCGVKRKTHVVVCELVHGPRPFPLAETAHSCGVPMCVNPAHLRWATKSENQLDRRLHGTDPRGERHPKAKLTQAQVDAIRSEYAAGGETHRSLAARYGVDHRVIGLIIQRRIWKG